MRPLYIFDLDGTLSLAHHRQPTLDDKTNPNRWRDFYAACDKDLPNESVIRVMLGLRLVSDIWIFSGRSSEVRGKTIDWLASNLFIPTWRCDEILTMRKEGDYTPDDVLKKSWLDAMSPIDRQRLVATFDDRDRVVKMWRDNGVTCFQVASGDF